MELKNKLYRGFVSLAGLFLIVTCLAKLVSVFGYAEALTLPDALFGWQTRWVMVLSALTEACVVGLLMSRAAPLTKLSGLLWLSLNFASYRFSLWLIGASTACPCMGSTYGLIGVGAATMEHIMAGIVLVLVAGSSYLIRHLYFVR